MKSVQPIVLFYDIATPMVYTNQTLQEFTVIRGSESTVIRLAHRLKNYYTIYVAQHCRATNNNQISDGVHYISFETAHDLAPDFVIFLRHGRLVDTVFKRFPHAKHFFWMHNLPMRNLYSKLDVLSKHQCELIAISHFHAKTIEKRLEGKWYQRIFQKNNKKSRVPVRMIYSPIEDHLTPDNTVWNPNQMIVTSASYKGLPEILKRFYALQTHFPEYELLISKPPSHMRNKLKLSSSIRFLEPLPYHQLIQHIRESFCVFYPQTERVETFGLIYAESNAVGTPVLAHDFGAASEILSDSSQLINGKSMTSIIEKITEWRKNRPLVQANNQLRLSRVMQDWLALLKK